VAAQQRVLWTIYSPQGAQGLVRPAQVQLQPHLSVGLLSSLSAGWGLLALAMGGAGASLASPSPCRRCWRLGQFIADRRCWRRGLSATISGTSAPIGWAVAIAIALGQDLMPFFAVLWAML